MKKLLITITLLLNTLLFANINTVVSIVPQKTFLKAIGGDKINVSIMVKPGNSPHTYEPKPSQMKDIANADIYFTIGVEFEHVWLDKFKNTNNSMKIIDLAKGVEKMPMAEHNHHHGHEAKKHTVYTEDTKDEKSLDPHIWTNPRNVKIIAKNILEALKDKDPKNSDYYIKNYNDFIILIEKTNSSIKEILKESASKKFMVFHPSWSYFAKEYNLKQLAMELEGKSPKPKELIMLLKEAKEEKITVIFTQPEFSDTSAKVIANELKIANAFPAFCLCAKGCE